METSQANKIGHITFEIGHLTVEVLLATALYSRFVSV